MKKIIYIALFFTSFCFSQEYEFVENLKGFISLEKGVLHDLKLASSLKKNSVISLKIKVNNVKGNGAYLVGLPSYKNSFGFYTSNKKVRLISYYKTFSLVAKNLDGSILDNSDIPKGEWIEVIATLKSPSKTKKLLLGLHLYEGDSYDIRALKVNDIDVLPKPQNKLYINTGMHKTSGNRLERLKIKNGIVTPETFGWKPIFTNDQSKWKDAKMVLEKCFNSGYTCNVGGGIYPVWSTVNANIATTINLSGQGKVNKFLDNHSLTKIIPMGDFDVISINSKNVFINYGNIYTGLVKGGHNKAGFKYNSNGQVFGGELNRITVLGKREHLYKTNGGTRAVDFETLNITNNDPHSSYLDFTNLWIENCYSGIGKKMQSKEAKDAGLWINSLTITNPKILNTKLFFDFEYGSNIKVINANLHDSAVLTLEERNFNAVNIPGVSHSDFEYQIYDSHGGRAEKKGNVTIYRHKNIISEVLSSTTINNRFNKR